MHYSHRRVSRSEHRDSYQHAGRCSRWRSPRRLCRRSRSSSSVRRYRGRRNELLALPQDQLEALFASEPELVIVALPGEGGVAIIGDGTLSRPGRYLLFCAIPTGANPAEYMRQAQASQAGPPQVDGGPHHFTAGMYAQVAGE